MRQTEKRFKTDLGEIRYWVSYAEQDAPWLVMLPGLSADHLLFEKQLEYFGERYHCFVWDAPAHGLSRPFILRFTMDDLADYLHEIFQREGITCPVMIGQSLGGYIAQVYMDRYPDSVSGFISIDSCPMKRQYYARWELAFMRRTKWMYMSIPWRILLPWGIWGTSSTKYGRNVMRKIWSVYEKEEFCTLADYGYRILVEALEQERAYRIDCPALLLCGEKDLAGSAKRYNRQWHRQEGIPLVWLKNAGHNSNTDVPNEVNALIENFVNGL